MAVFQNVNLTDLQWDEFNREWILPNGGRLSEECVKRWTNNYLNGRSKLFIDNSSKTK